MSLIVRKYGGTSVADLERIRNAARSIAAFVHEGNMAVVVVSAMAGETDRLLDLSGEANPAGEPRELAAIAATGELVVAGLMAITLAGMGIRSISMNGFQAGIRTVGKHHKARIEQVDPKNILQALEDGATPVVAGYQGMNGAAETTTLGRGGSDTTAVALAASVAADECQIYTDVDGIFTCDPQIVSDARRIAHIHFEELLEMTSMGAKVLNVRAADYAAKKKVPMRILSSLADDPVGTLVTYEENGAMEKPVVTGIALNREEAKITLVGVSDRPGVASQIFGDIAKEEIDVDMIIQNVGLSGKTDLSFTVHRSEYDHALKIVRGTAERLGAREVVGDNAIGKLSAIGIGMKSHSGVAGRMFEILASENINIQMISTSEIKISVVIEEKYLELGARALHTAFGLETEPQTERAVPGHKR
jgi:aspartate kinase